MASIFERCLVAAAGDVRAVAAGGMHARRQAVDAGVGHADRETDSGVVVLMSLAVETICADATSKEAKLCSEVVCC